MTSERIRGTSRRKRLAAVLVVSVQDRRCHTRTLQETRQRKAALLPLDTLEVAHRLRAMRPPQGLLDSQISGSGPSSTENDDSNSVTGPSVVLEPIKPRTSGAKLPLTSYKRWAEEGFPMEVWRPLLENELYHPLEAEKTLITKKYQVRRKSISSHDGSQ
ncbi:hypothetical protein ERJ75_000133500 [Trypanosoma vivax]|uniref:Uncharacterized protein n=1 Tax=Trypanosoma vivax (strain Y486) TaxID=1055687 RepID=G0TT35_TRYVY|nr:hypothetical protein TRVL_02805 [Trypanosoma vivax]KAH8619763.1 hypothetical protein ERJ75_000133500 [Trypanosoma vivax]CCC47116.1 conserved hypothetical protein [Trypanosoma vivax Y486]